MSDSNLDPSKWENLSLSDLTHINKFARDKLNPPGTPDEKSFYALDVNWVGIVSPAIPSGR